MYALVLNQEFIRSSWMNDFGIPPIYENKSYFINHTYLGGVGLIGGAWGLAAAVYALLFGANTSRPWELIDSFELFLQENVIHVHYLNGIRDKLAKPRATSTSTTDAMNTTQQQEGLMVTVPPQSSITNISDANDILYDDNNIRQ
ncbi:hypothetical protein GLOIN_2v1776888 [Rhizophagus irregularis DAOM 181602=DAOM 197198]|nr:hypothetical protein GLOIN_2v1776888 [Rhizophagus irregularis DAOM 181602=DAOM 197198]